MTRVRVGFEERKTRERSLSLVNCSKHQSNATRFVRRLLQALRYYKAAAEAGNVQALNSAGIMTEEEGEEFKAMEVRVPEEQTPRGANRRSAANIPAMLTNADTSLTSLSLSPRSSTAGAWWVAKMSGRGLATARTTLQRCAKSTSATSSPSCQRTSRRTTQCIPSRSA